MPLDKKQNLMVDEGSDCWKELYQLVRNKSLRILRYLKNIFLK